MKNEQIRPILRTCIIICAVLLVIQRFSNKRSDSEDVSAEMSSELPALTSNEGIESPEVEAQLNEIQTLAPPVEERPVVKNTHSESITTSLLFSKPNDVSPRSARERIDLIEQILTHYERTFSENPAGASNAKIVKQLLGDNPLDLAFLSPESNAIQDGKLVDNWGTPYYFHEVSRQQFDIISSGPDKERWTDDDISNKTSSGADSLW